MGSTTRILAACVAIAFIHLACQAAELEIVGRVVDADGKPVANAIVEDFWRANGPATKADGTPFDLSDPRQRAEFWGHIGEMAPFGGAKSAEDGAFTVAASSRSRALLAIDPSRTCGGIAMIPRVIPRPYAGQPLEIQLRPMTTVRGRMRSSVGERKFDWCHVYVELPRDPKNPLANNRLVSCGSENGQFEFRLPPGQYRLDAYAVSDEATDSIDLRVRPVPKLTIDGTARIVDLGVLELTAGAPMRGDLEKAAKAAGRWRDYTQHYGEPAPNWHATDARGISRDAKVADFRGKWLLINFWGLSCTPCLATGIPKSMAFYEAHADMRDRFEIIGMCIEFPSGIDNMAALDRALAPIEKHVWHGKQIPFPIVLDPTFTTWERFGIPGLGTVILIDPNGNLVEGGESTLEAILRQDAMPTEVHNSAPTPVVNGEPSTPVR